MRFSIKLVLCTTAIIAVIFSCAGVFIVNQNFEYSLDTTVNQNISQHILERYAMESNIVNNVARGDVVTDKKIEEYASSLSSYVENNNRMIGVYTKEKTKIFSNFIEEIQIQEIEGILRENNDHYRILKIEGGRNYMLLASFLKIGGKQIYVVNGYDVTRVFEERDRQITSFLVLDAIIIAAAMVSIFIFSLFLTNPIKRLNQISKEIATGSYHKRSRVKSNDEIGELSDSFNIMAEQIEDKIDKLNLAMKQKDDFLSSFTHEIKNPMTAIIGYSQFLLHNECDSKTKEKALGYIYSESKRLELLSHKLMELMCLSEDKIMVKPVNVKQLADQIAKEEESYLKDITLITELEQATIKGDELLLNSMIRNLIENARKAEPKDHKVYLKGECVSEERYRISITDTGVGIPKEEVSRVVEDFYMVDKSRAKSKGSSGIGLSICQKIANLHHSKIIIESELGKGTTVYFDLEVLNYEE